MRTRSFSFILVRITASVTNHGPAISRILATFVRECSASVCSATFPWINPVTIKRRINTIITIGKAPAKQQTLHFMV